MPRRYEGLSGTAPISVPLRLGTALRQRLRHGYSREDLRGDLLAGMVVGIVALPLSMALAVASGVAPQYGLYTAIVAGAVVAALGGSMVQVSGPTAAFVVLLAPISAKFGLGGLILATLMAGILLVVMGIARLGGLIQFVPYPVTTGFTAGIAVVIATLQLKDFLGLSVAKMPQEYLERVAALARALPTVRWEDLAIGLFTLAVLLLWPRITRKIPGAAHRPGPRGDPGRAAHPLAAGLRGGHHSQPVRGRHPAASAPAESSPGTCRGRTANRSASPSG